MKTLVVTLFCALFAAPALAQPFANGADADGVLGQIDLASNTPDTQAEILRYPRDMAIGPTGKLFVADCNNSRVLRWASADAMLDASDAEAVLGQVNFTDGLSNGGGALGDWTVQCPYSVAVDAAGSLWVSDQANNRILRFDNAESLTDGASADGVLGQADFVSNSANRGGSAAANTLYSPRGIAVDAAGRLWVADQGNHRVLRYDNASAKADGADADGVLGQPLFTSATRDQDDMGTIAAGMNSPYDTAVDENGVLWVADKNNSRIMRWDNAAAASNGANADGVLGQPTLAAGQANQGGAASASTLNQPLAVAVDALGHLWVADRNNNRLLWYDDAANQADGAAADGVLGQADFTSTSANRGGSVAANTLNQPEGMAIDPVNEILWLADVSNHRLLRFDAVLGTLPVELTAFTVRRDGRQVQLAWTTASETNNAGFHVERSADGGATFQAVGYVEGRGTAGGETRYRYTDAAPARDVVYRLKQVDFDGRFSYSRTALAPALVEAYALEASYPNPFNPVTTIAYETPVDGAVRLAVYDVLGKEVAVLVDGEQAAGRHAVSFDAAGLPSGIYFYRMTAGSASFTRTMQLMK
ncbi:MAG: T9SS type A sorting domain-containing protein [Rhodothermales bacterium]